MAPELANIERRKIAVVPELTDIWRRKSALARTV
jgi:hypothetical protein